MSKELVEKAEAAAANAYAPYSNYLVGAVVRARDGREFAGVNVENAAYPLGICAEKTAIAAAVVGRLPAGRPRGDRDHRLAVRRLPPVAARVPDRRGQLPRRRRRAAHRDARPSCCRTPGICPNEVGLRRARRPPERRQVDARERAHRREGRDRLDTSRTRPAIASAASGRARTPSSCSSTCPGWQRPIDPLTERMQEPRRGDDRRRPRRRRARRQRARADRRRRPLRRPPRLRARRARS